MMNMQGEDWACDCGLSIYVVAVTRKVWKEGMLQSFSQDIRVQT